MANPGRRLGLITPLEVDSPPDLLSALVMTIVRQNWRPLLPARSAVGWSDPWQHVGDTAPRVSPPSV